MNIDIDPINFEGDHPPTAKRRWRILLVIILIGAVGGIFAAKKHERDQKNAIFDHPFSTAVVSKNPDKYTINYKGEGIGGKYCVDIGKLRIVTLRATHSYYGTSTGSINLSENSSSSSSSSGGNSWDLEITSKDFKADVKIGPIRFEIDRTTATINDQSFDIEKTKNVLVVDHAGNITEQRVIP